MRNSSAIALRPTTGSAWAAASDGDGDDDDNDDEGEDVAGPG
jgi:hypothetical protein